MTAIKLAYHAGFGGDGEIRTLAPVSRPTPLAGEPLHRLGYISKWVVCAGYLVVEGCWRREWDSNPRLFRVTGFQDRLLKPLGHLSSSFQTNQRRGLSYHTPTHLSRAKMDRLPIAPRTDHRSAPGEFFSDTSVQCLAQTYFSLQSLVDHGEELSPILRQSAF